MTYAYALDEPIGLSEAESRAVLGGKAANLGVMARDLGLPVPPELRHHHRGLPPLPGRRLAGRRSGVVTHESDVIAELHRVPSGRTRGPRHKVVKDLSIRRAGPKSLVEGPAQT